MWMMLVTILLLAFTLYLRTTGAFTAYFGTGKSRKIGGGLLGGGVLIGLFWVIATGPLNLFGTFGLWDVVVQTIVILIAALIGAAAAIGLFLLAIMKS